LAKYVLLACLRCERISIAVIFAQSYLPKGFIIHG
jgi:hypothetical protein